MLICDSDGNGNGKGMTVGEVRLPGRDGSPPLAAASAAYLVTLSGPEQRNTQRAYRSTLRALTAEFAPAGTSFAVADLGSEENAERLTEWFTARWSGRAAATFNRHLDAIRSAASFWIGQGWLAADPSRRLPGAQGSRPDPRARRRRDRGDPRHGRPGPGEDAVDDALRDRRPIE